MQFLIDNHAREVERRRDTWPTLVCGQLLTPLTKYTNWGGTFAIDNGAYSGLNTPAFRRLLDRESGNKANCLFACCPDIVGNGRRTLELWRHRSRWGLDQWPAAFVGQDGIEDLDIPWGEMACLFIGGLDRWKMSRACLDLVATAKALGVRVHIGRVNTPERWRKFAEAGADTCDGTGVSRYDHMLAAIYSDCKQPELPLGV